jgi:hypothetical protein
VEALPCQQYCLGSSVGSCGGYAFITCTEADQGTRAYFDLDSGALVSVVQHFGPTVSAKCNTPSMGFSDPDCDTYEPLPSCLDGG